MSLLKASSYSFILVERLLLESVSNITTSMLLVYSGYAVGILTTYRNRGLEVYKGRVSRMTTRCLMKYSGFQVNYLMLAFLLHQLIIWVVFSIVNYWSVFGTLKIILFCPVFTIQLIMCLLSMFVFLEGFFNYVYFFIFYFLFVGCCL